MTLSARTLLPLWYCFFVFQFAQAQLTITYPIPRSVIQRSQANTALLYVAGTFSVPVDRMEARLVSTSIANRINVDWNVLQDKPKNGLFRGSLTAPAGSYQLEVRGIRNEKTVSIASVPVGIGEVFVIAGQSNAMGLPNLGAKGASERVVVFNAWNRFWNKNDALESSDKPFPTPTFSTLTATSLVYPTGETAWCWGELGDYIADRYDVPVAFFNVAIPATVAENWSNSAKGIPAKNIFNSTIWPFLQPYSNLRNTLQYYNSQFGIRAILWHHGESDASPLQTSTETYREDIQYLINRSRADFDRSMTWVIARCSNTLADPVSNAAIRQAQNLLIKTFSNNVWEGPDTDSIQLPRPAHGHFENIVNGVQGLSDFANAWKKSLSDQFFRQSQPQQPQQFIQTGLVPSEIPAGTTFSVPYDLLGFSAKPDVAIQLVNNKGLFVAEIGRDKGNGAARVYLPDTLSPGQYQLRTVATNPVLAGAQSLPFNVVSPALPLNYFVDVQIERRETVTAIHWLTAQEPVGSRFTVERKDSLGAYQSIGTVNAIVDDQLSHLYSFTDPVNNTGENRYRIRLEQSNGRVQFSNQLVLASANEPLPQPVVYPNPSDGTNLMIRLPRSGQWNLTLINLSGQTLWQQQITTSANRTSSVPLISGLPAGLYSLQLQNADQYFAKPILIQR